MKLTAREQALGSGSCSKFVGHGITRNKNAWGRQNVRRYVRKYCRKNVRKNVRRYVSKTVRRYVRRDVREDARRCQKEYQTECQEICQKECQKIWQKDCQERVYSMALVVIHSMGSAHVSDGRERQRMANVWRQCQLCSPIIDNSSCGIKVDNNPHLTTPTRHVMVGITRSRVIFFSLQLFLNFFINF